MVGEPAKKLTPEASSADGTEPTDLRIRAPLTEEASRVELAPD